MPLKFFVADYSVMTSQLGRFLPGALRRPMQGVPLLFQFLVVISLAVAALPALANGLPRTIEKVKPSVVGVGSYLKTRSPSAVFFGTGFAVGDGLSVITNAHVVKHLMAEANNDTSEQLGIIVGRGELTEFRRARVIAIDTEHDLALLQIGGTPLPVLEIGDSAKVVEGQSVAFTGFPLGMTLGLHHATHRATVASLTPIVMPAITSAKLDVKMIAQLRKPPFVIFQLDGTAYPGNSGSPLYDPETGVVVGVINMVFVKGVKEAAISNPSGIAYAIPSQYVRELLQRK